MTPRFYQYFDLLQKTLTAFNKKCDCTGVSVIVSFEQSLGTKNTNNDYTLWIGKFSSETFGNQRFGGPIQRVSELLTSFIEKLIAQTLEAAIANADEWYKDKPEVKIEVYALQGMLTELGETKWD